MPKKIDLDKLSDEELLDLRLCDLPVRVEGTWLEECIQKVHRELEKKGLAFRPECYLADEWLTPENEPVVGIPFYLAHPALMRLEKKMMLEVEGDNKEWCLSLLRHETGHAICYAYRLNRKRKWRKIFGFSSEEYGDTYRFRPYSKNFVRHLEDYYAQYHPDEDFVETFAVWLTPGSNWREEYRGWGAMRKLRYVDELMRSLRGKEPVAKKGTKYWRISTLRSTLRTHYKKKKQFWAEEFPDYHDANLQRIFVSATEAGKNLSGAHRSSGGGSMAEQVITSYRKDILNSVSRWTGERKYIISDLLKKFAGRCRELKLVVPESEAQAILRVAVYTTTLIMNYRYTGRFAGEDQK